MLAECTFPKYVVCIVSLAVRQKLPLLLSVTPINKLRYNFLWKGKNYKIRNSGVCQAYDVGGLKMVDIKSVLAALKISWLKRILHDDGKLSKSYKQCVH